MTISDSFECQVTKLLQNNLSERKVAEMAGVTRRQVRKIKEQLAKQGSDNLLGLDIQPTITRSEAVSALVQLSTRPGGVRSSEMSTVLRGLYGLRINQKTRSLELAMTEHQLRYLKERTKAAALNGGKEALFVPEWLPRCAPGAAIDFLVKAADCLHQRAQELVSDFMLVFPEVSPRSVFQELIFLSFREASPEPVLTRCERNKEAADKLQQRLGFIAKKPVTYEAVRSLPDPELDRLCI